MNRKTERNSPIDSLCFNQIVSEYQERLYWHIRKIVLIHEDTDDVLQNTFIKVYKGLESFRGDSSLSTWLYRIAYNEAINHFRSKHKSFLFSSDARSESVLRSLQADPYFDGGEAELLLQKAIVNLPRRQKAVFIMRYYDELSYAQISEILDVSIGALKASYHRAFQKIKQYIQCNEIR